MINIHKKYQTHIYFIILLTIGNTGSERENEHIWLVTCLKVIKELILIRLSVIHVWHAHRLISSMPYFFVSKSLYHTTCTCICGAIKTNCSCIQDIYIQVNTRLNFRYDTTSFTLINYINKSFAYVALLHKDYWSEFHIVITPWIDCTKSRNKREQTHGKPKTPKFSSSKYRP